MSMNSPDDDAIIIRANAFISSQIAVDPAEIVELVRDLKNHVEDMFVERRGHDMQAVKLKNEKGDLELAIVNYMVHHHSHTLGSLPEEPEDIVAQFIEEYSG